MERTIVVGDVHGCLDELQALLRECGVARGERVVLAGDLVAKGPDSRGVVRLVRETGALAVLGNHDDYCLDVWRRRQQGESRRPRRWSLDALDESDWAFLASLPLFVRLGPEREGGPEAAVVHAGAVPGVPLENQERDNLLTLRSMVAGVGPSTSCSDTTRFVACSSTRWRPGWTPGACTVVCLPRWNCPRGASIACRRGGATRPSSLC